jgi:predicted nicotinamide N-methyase
MAKKKREEKATQRQAYGITVLKAADARIRRLRKEHEPSIHGNKFWSSSWVIMDYLEHQGLPDKARVLEVGCGWGLAGIYCARKHGARVTGVDADQAVFPYLELHARINEVEIETRCCGFEELTAGELAGQDVVIGADICFWDEMVDPVYRMVRRSVGAGARQVIIADPGRPPFSLMSERCARELGGEIKEWEVDGQVKASAYLLIVGSLPW